MNGLFLWILGLTVSILALIFILDFIFDHKSVDDPYDVEEDDDSE